MPVQVLLPGVPAGALCGNTKCQTWFWFEVGFFTLLGWQQLDRSWVGQSGSGRPEQGERRSERERDVPGQTNGLERSSSRMGEARSAMRAASASVRRKGGERGERASRAS